MLFDDLLSLLRRQVGPTLAQLVLTTIACAVAMAMMVMMTTEAYVAHQQPAKHQQPDCLPERQDRQTEDHRHQPVPKPHDEATQQADHCHEEKRYKNEMFLQ